MNRDLTTGRPGRVLCLFCLPLVGSVIFQQLYNLADSLIAGRFIGEAALAAVGNSYEITLIFIAFAFGCNMGCSVLVSRLFGAGDQVKLKNAVSTGMLFSGALVLVLMVLGLFFGRILMGWIQTPEQIMESSLLYLNIYIIGLPFLFFYNIANGIFSGLGDSKTPFWFLAASSSANIVMDALFVVVFHMGVAGVAWATFLCQGISCISALAVLFCRLKPMAVKEKVPLFSMDLLRQILSISIPSTLQQSFVSVGNIVIQGVINGFGPSVIAGYAAGVKLNNLVITCFTTVGNGISNYTAQNLGAGKMNRIPQGFTAGLKLIWCVAVPFAALFLVAGRMTLSLFMEESATLAMHTGQLYLSILAPFYVVVSAKLVSDGVLRGAGHMNPFMVGTFTDLILRVALGIVLARTTLGSTGIWIAWPIGWSVSTVISQWYYWKHFGRQKRRKLI